MFRRQARPLVTLYALIALTISATGMSLRVVTAPGKCETRELPCHPRTMITCCCDADDTGRTPISQPAARAMTLDPGFAPVAGCSMVAPIDRPLIGSHPAPTHGHSPGDRQSLLSILLI